MTGFVINEDLKERCLLLGARSCYTEFYPKSNFLPHSPYWYNKISFPQNTNKNYILVLCSLVDEYLEELISLGFDNIITDVRHANTHCCIYYWILCDREEFLEKTFS